MPSEEQEARILAEAGLTKRQKECLVLYCYDCKTMGEIAEILGISKPRVHGHVHAGIQKLGKAGMKIRRLQFEPKRVAADLDRLGPKEIRAIW